MKLLHSHSFWESKYSKIWMKFWIKAIMKNFWHKKRAYKVETKDKKFQINYPTYKVAVHTHDERNSKNVVKNVPGPRRAVKMRLFTYERLFISDEILEQFIAHHREVIENSEKHSFYKSVDLTDIKAFLGLLYLRARLKLNLFDRETIWHHETANYFFEATMSLNGFTFISRFITFDDKSTHPKQ